MFPETANKTLIYSFLHLKNILKKNALHKKGF